MSMTFADGAELVLRDAGEALPVPELWKRMAARGLVETAGATPEQTLRVTLLRQAAGSSLAAGKGTPRFYRRGDGAFGLWAELATAQQHALTSTSTEAPPPVRMREFAADRDGMRADPAVAERALAWMIPGDGPRRAAIELMAGVIEDAHAAGANRWKLTLGARSLRVTVGRCLVLWIRREVWFPVRLGELAQGDRTIIEGLGVHDTTAGPFRSIAPVEFYTITPDLVSEASAAIRRALASIITEAAAASPSDLHGARFHSPGALAYLSAVVGRPLPAPGVRPRPEDAESRKRRRTTKTTRRR
ncbi:MAG: winged helix-turn-helix domain-containing protein [Myxococcales bacterium]|nr:winged helix-turn-helix domain-containing protein [Myxococcales bacterium]